MKVYQIKILNFIGHFLTILENNCNLYKLYISKNKLKTLELLNNLNYPTTKLIPKSFITDDDYIVCKPIYGKCGKGIYFSKPNNIIPSKIFNNQNYIFEKYEYGRHYRVVFYRNKINTVYERIIPKVIGNNRDTIQKLVQKKNKERKLNNQIYLDLNNNDPNYIPKDGQIIECTQLCHYLNGGSIKYLNIDDIPKSTVGLLTKLSQELNLNIFAIDIIASDLTRSYKYQNVFCINELEYCNDWGTHFIFNDKFSRLCKLIILKWFLVFGFFILFFYDKIR